MGGTGTPHPCLDVFLTFAGSAEGEQIPIIMFSLHLEFQVNCLTESSAFLSISFSFL